MVPSFQKCPQMDAGMGNSIFTGLFVDFCGSCTILGNPFPLFHEGSIQVTTIRIFSLASLRKVFVGRLRINSSADAVEIKFS
jgi:hypothetical protein